MNPDWPLDRIHRAAVRVLEVVEAIAEGYVPQATEREVEVALLIRPQMPARVEAASRGEQDAIQYLRQVWLQAHAVLSREYPMPALKPSGDTVQTLYCPSPLTAPYTLRGTVCVPTGTGPFLAMRKAPSTWLVSQSKRIARIDGRDYWHVASRVDSGTAASYVVDDLTDPPLNYDGSGEVDYPLWSGEAYLNSITPGHMSLGFLAEGGSGQFQDVSITGPWDGTLFDGPVMRVGYRHIRVPNFGWLYITFTILADTDEIGVAMKWHNSAVEERAPSNPGTPETVADHGFPITQWKALQGDVTFSRVAYQCRQGYKMVPRFTDPVHNLDVGADGQGGFVKIVGNGGPKHVFPMLRERIFRFAIVPIGVTPYLKEDIAVQDWEADLGGFALTPFGVDDLSHLTVNLGTQATTAKTALANSTPWPSFGMAGISGSFGSVINPLWPSAWSHYGGDTSGNGMWAFDGSNWAGTRQRGGYELALVNQLRTDCRVFGRMYKNVSGDHLRHREVFPARRQDCSFFNGIFGENGGIPADAPFEFLQLPHDDPYTAYYPGRTTAFGQKQVILTMGNAALFNTPDQITITISGRSSGSADPDSIVEVLTLTGNASADQTKTSTNYFGVIDSITLNSIDGGASGMTFKIGHDIFDDRYYLEQDYDDLPNVNEQFPLAYNNVGPYPNYYGSDGLQSIDSQHFIRAHATNRNLYLLAYDPIARHSILADSFKSRLEQWEGAGNGHRLDTVHFGQAGRGAVISRELAWHCDVVSTALAIHAAEGFPVAAEWLPWVNAVKALFKGSQMPSGLIQAFSPKEAQFAPYGDGSSNRYYLMTAGRETAYFCFAITQLAYLHGAPDAEMLQVLSDLGRGQHDLGWKDAAIVTPAKPGPIIYIPVGVAPGYAGADDPRFVVISDLPATNPFTAAALYTAGLVSEDTGGAVYSESYHAPYMAALARAAAIAAGDTTGEAKAESMVLRNTNNAANLAAAKAQYLTRPESGSGGGDVVHQWAIALWALRDE